MGRALSEAGTGGFVVGSLLTVALVNPAPKVLDCKGEKKALLIA
jgi:hypothetical protein